MILGNTPTSVGFAILQVGTKKGLFMNLLRVWYEIEWKILRLCWLVVWVFITRPSLAYRRARTFTRVTAYVAKDSRIESFELSSDAVGVLGDARFFGPSVILKLKDCNWQEHPEEAGRIATNLVNQTPGVTRVLIEVR